MDSLFDAKGSAAYVARIRSLTPTSEAQWGKMNAPQALAHCRLAINVALGDRPLKRSFIGLLLGGMFKKKIVDSPEPFRKNQPTDPKLVLVDSESLASEQDQLVVSVERFTAFGPDGMPTGPHPFFGKMSPAQWDRLMSKHIDHHLRQFDA